jgi:hypothetical protein
VAPPAADGAAAPRRRAVASSLPLPLLLLAGLLLALAATPARGDDDPARTLAERYSPIVAVRDQSGPCDRDGEAYRPVAVQTVLGVPGVRLRGADGRVVKDAPTMDDIVGLGPKTSLDFPGNPRRPGCRYERDFDRLGRGQPDVVYAHVAGDPAGPGRLALQYWLFWYFDDYVNTHEGDWEFVQLVWDVSTPREALATAPSEVGYSQHSGGERAAWDAGKLEREGDHPVVHVAAGSHANYYSADLFLGRSADEGFGCDNARAPDTRLRPEVRLLPTGEVDPRGPDRWLLFRGRWGEFQPPPYDAPPGPLTKDEWIHPLEWQDGLRDGSFAIPVGTTLGPSATGAFCGTVRAGGRIYTAVTSPLALLLIAVGLVGTAGVAARSTAWSPRSVHPLRRERSAGQLLRAGAAAYRARARVLTAIGALFLPAAAVEVATQAAVLSYTPLGGLADLAGEHSLASALGALLVAGAGHALAATLVVGGVAIVLERDDRGEPPSVRAAYAGLRAAAPRLLGTALLIGIVALVLTLTLVGIPVVVWLLGRWAVAVQVAAIEGCGVRCALRRSRALTRGRWWRAVRVAALANAVGLVIGPVVGITLLFTTSLPLETVNVVSSAVYVAVMPLVGACLAYLYGDLVVRAGRARA